MFNNYSSYSQEQQLTIARKLQFQIEDKNVTYDALMEALGINPLMFVSFLAANAIAPIAPIGFIRNEDRGNGELPVDYYVVTQELLKNNVINYHSLKGDKTGKDLETILLFANYIPVYDITIHKNAIEKFGPKESVFSFEKDEWYIDRETLEYGIINAGTSLPVSQISNYQMFGTEKDRDNYLAIIKGYLHNGE